MNQNDKIVSLIKAYLDGRVLQCTAHQPIGCYSKMNGSVESTINAIVANPDSFKIKPKTRKITTRNWLTTYGVPILWYSDLVDTQTDIEAYSSFKQWLDSGVVHEVEV